MTIVGRLSRKRRDDETAHLPLPAGPVSNGEFIPGPATGRSRATDDVIRSTVDAAARRAGMDRRTFLQSAASVAASLTAFELAGCAANPPSHRTLTSRPPGQGGTFTVPSPHDTVACQEALASRGEFIFDVHTHHVIPVGPWAQNAPETVGLILGMLPAGCTDNPALDCVDRAAYLHDLFLASDTTMAVLTDVPNSGPSNAPIPFPDALNTQAIAAELTHGGASRLLVENVIAPNVGPLGATLDEMTSTAQGGHVAAFKVYTAWSPSGRGFSLEDPAIGLPTVQHAHDLGVKVFVAHKGLPLVNFDPPFNHPDDVVAVSRQFPDMKFVIYHAAWDPSHIEGPYDPAAAIGIDSLLSALDRHGVAPNDNIWVDTATMWRQLLTEPDQAAHALGKLLSRVGERRVMWGTDAIWYGSPQAQIMAMRAFQITAQYQDLYKYPALTDDTKAALFGLNAAELFGIDPTATRCALTTDPLNANISEAAALRSDGTLASPWTPHGPTTRRQVLSWLASPTTHWTPS
ncbi:MAG TPA: amidohydrolase family protein [Acidimicrobiales bacterium]|nr:amidohydrolase family protein [Acidimicrobiales bacterium]